MKVHGAMLRNMFVWVFFLLLAIPLVFHALSPFYTMGKSPLIENRVLARIALPQTKHDIINFPNSLRTWIDDTYGLRPWFVYLNNNLHYSVFRDIPRFGQQVAIGQEGYVFLGSHSVANPMSNMVNYTGISGAFALNEQAMKRLFEKSKHISDRVVYVSVPPKHILDTERYPSWLVDLAVSRRASVVRVMTELQEQTSGKFLFPYKEALELRKHHQLIPKTFFHWVPGPYTRMVASLAAKRLKVTKSEQYSNVLFVKQNRISDIQHLYPGFTGFTSTVEAYTQNHLSRNGITLQRYLFDDLESMPKASQVVTGTVLLKNSNSKTLNRLLLVGDSFAWAISGDFAEYFSQVVHITRNDFYALSAQEQKQYTDGILHSFKPTHCVQIAHGSYPEFFDEHISKFLTDNIKTVEGYGSVYVSKFDGPSCKFSKGTNGSRYLVEGWSLSEEWGTWSDGDRSRIVLVPQQEISTISINARFFLPPSRPRQSVIISINEIAAYERRFDGRDIVQATGGTHDIVLNLTGAMKQKIAKDGYVMLEFSFPDACTPKEMNYNSDTRKLALGINAMTIE